jgi:hypothetical protein
MAFEDDVLDISLIAGEDLYSSTVNYQYHFVKLSADNTVVHCDGASDIPVGVLQNKPASGQIARVRVMGVSRVVIGTGTFAFSNKVGTDASGHGVSKSADKAVFMGEAIMGGAAATLGTVIIHPPHTVEAS